MNFQKSLLQYIIRIQCTNRCAISVHFKSFNIISNSYVFSRLIIAMINCEISTSNAKIANRTTTIVIFRFYNKYSSSIHPQYFKLSGKSDGFQVLNIRFIVSSRLRKILKSADFGILLSGCAKILTS